MRIYFSTSKFHHKLRAKRKKDREKEVSTLGSVFESCVNGKISEISRNLLKKVELRSGHSVDFLRKIVILHCPFQWEVRSGAHYRGAAALRLWDGGLRNMLFANSLVWHFSRMFGEKTIWNWPFPRLGELKQVRGTPGNSCNPSANHSKHRSLVHELANFRNFTLVWHFSETFGEKTAATMTLSRVRSSHRTTWHSSKLVQPSWKLIFQATWTRFPISRMWTVGAGWKERFRK